MPLSVWIVSHPKYACKSHLHNNITSSCDLVREVGCSECEPCPLGKEADAFASNCVNCSKGQYAII